MSDKDQKLSDKYAELLIMEEDRHPLVDVLNRREVESAIDVGETEDAPLVKGSRMDGTTSPGSSGFVGCGASDRANAAYANGADRFAGDDQVPFAHVKEKPWHRALAYFAAQGLSAKEQCAQFGGQFDPTTRQYIAGSGQHAYGTILNINRQPWFKQRVIDTLREAGSDKLGAWLESEVMPSLETLKKLRDNTQTPASVRHSSARELLDRFLGKPQQPYMKPPEASDPEAEAKELEAEIARLQTQG